MASSCAEEIAYHRKRHPEWKFACLADVLTVHGREFQRGMPPRRRGRWHRTPKQCYRNAFLNVQTDPARFVYVEGYCFAESYMFAHAWFVDRREPNRALDTTLSWDGPHYYFGVPIKWEYVLHMVASLGMYGSVFEWYEAGYPI